MDSNSLKESFLSYLRHERGLAPSTVVTYAHHVRAYLAFLKEAGRAPAEATTEHVQSHIGGLRARGLRPAPVFCASVAIRSFHQFLLAKGHASQDPSAGLESPKLVTRVSEPLSVEEVERLLAAVPGHGFAHLRDAAILELLYGCGLRLGEALGLDLGQVHLSEGYVRVLGKGSRERLVPFGPKVVEALRRYFTARVQRIGEVDGPLFVARAGGRLGKGSFGRRFKRLAARAEIGRRVYPHLLRHTYAVHLLAGRVDLRSLQLLLGHYVASSVMWRVRRLPLLFGSDLENLLAQAVTPSAAIAV